LLPVCTSRKEEELRFRCKSRYLLDWLHEVIVAMDLAVFDFEAMLVAMSHDPGHQAVSHDSSTNLYFPSSSSRGEIVS
jgi:hypothetical protein